MLFICAYNLRVHVIGWIYNVLVDVGDIAFVMAVFILLPLSLLKSKRGFAGRMLKIVSVIFVLDLWAYALGVLWNAWGLLAVVIGVIFTPVAASIIAIIASFVHRDWVASGVIVLYILMFIGAYAGGDALERARVA